MTSQVYRRWIELTKHAQAKARIRPGAKNRLRPLLTSYNRTRAKLYGTGGRKVERDSDESDADFDARYGVERDENGSVHSEDDDGERSTVTGRGGDDNSTVAGSPVAETSRTPVVKARPRPPKRKPGTVFDAPDEDDEDDEDEPSPKRRRRGSTQAEPEIDGELAEFYVAVPPPRTTRSGRVSKRGASA